MAEEQQQTNQPEHDSGGDPQPQPQPAKHKLLQRWERIPPKYRKNPWWIGGTALAALILVIWAGDCMAKVVNSPDAPESVPAVAVAEAPTLTPVAGLIPDRPTPTPLPAQYSFSHFVEEMSVCYRQRGIVATLEGVEADIMVDVPLAVNSLLRLYADDLCAEEDPWHQIRGRVGWMLRAADVPLPELPEPAQQ